MNQNDLPPVRSVGFAEAVRNFFVKYAAFSGRATRKEFWFATLFLALISTSLSLLAYWEVPLAGILATVFSWGTTIPSLAVTFRRLHDAGCSGWNILLLLVPLLGAVMFLIMLCLASEEDNDYGERIV